MMHGIRKFEEDKATRIVEEIDGIGENAGKRGKKVKKVIQNPGFYSM
jgi:hypothetical protein